MPHSDTESERDNKDKANAISVTGNVVAWRNCPESIHFQSFKDFLGIFSACFLTT